MKLLVQFPTLSRSDKFLKCLDAYVGYASGHNEIFFNINCDSSDLTMTDPHVQERIMYILSKSSSVDGVVNFDINMDKIDAINAHIDDKEFDIVICASDDMVPQKANWDEKITTAMSENFPDLDGCVHFNDGHTAGKLVTFSILGKKLYEHFGYIYHPDYKGLYCDDEFTQEVTRMDKVAYIDEIIITHEHYSIEGTENHGHLDLAAKKTLFYSGRDGAVFEERKKLGFPRERITND